MGNLTLQNMEMAREYCWRNLSAAYNFRGLEGVGVSSGLHHGRQLRAQIPAAQSRKRLENFAEGILQASGKYRDWGQHAYQSPMLDMGVAGWFGPNVSVIASNHGIAVGMPIRLQAGDDADILLETIAGLERMR
jgi:hypothetical protein